MKKSTSLLPDVVVTKDSQGSVACEEECQRAIRLMLALKTGEWPVATTNRDVTSFVFEDCPYEIRPATSSDAEGADDFDNMAFYGFRYCLGRQTYVVRECVDILTRNWNRLTNASRIIIKSEINYAFEHNRYGSETDRAVWAEVLDLAGGNTRPSSAMTAGGDQGGVAGSVPHQSGSSVSDETESTHWSPKNDIAACGAVGDVSLTNEAERITCGACRAIYIPAPTPPDTDEIAAIRERNNRTRTDDKFAYFTLGELQRIADIGTLLTAYDALKGENEKWQRAAGHWKATSEVVETELARLKAAVPAQEMGTTTVGEKGSVQHETRTRFCGHAVDRPSDRTPNLVKHT